MSLVKSAWVICPYCGERVELIVDCSIESQQYIEDCFVCCKPINLSVEIDGDGDVRIDARHENDI